MTRAKVLISTAWWPTKSRCFGQYSEAVAVLLSHQGYDSELFITTSYAETKFRSITKSMAQAQRWAEGNGFSHVLNLEADTCLGGDSIASMLGRGKPVVYAGRNGYGFERYNPCGSRIQGWGAVLVTVEVLKQAPFDSYKGPWAWPDWMWLKRLNQLGIEVWIDREVDCKILEKPSTTLHACITEEAS